MILLFCITPLFPNNEFGIRELCDTFPEHIGNDLNREVDIPSLSPGRVPYDFHTFLMGFSVPILYQSDHGQDPVIPPTIDEKVTFGDDDLRSLVTVQFRIHRTDPARMSHLLIYIGIVLPFFPLRRCEYLLANMPSTWIILCTFSLCHKRIPQILRIL